MKKSMLSVQFLTAKRSHEVQKYTHSAIVENNSRRLDKSLSNIVTLGCVSAVAYSKKRDTITKRVRTCCAQHKAASGRRRNPP